MANEKRLIDANELVSLMKYYDEQQRTDMWETSEIEHLLGEIPTVQAVEVDDMREFAKDVAYQFGYYCQNGGRLHITHGGLYTLEWAFDILGWENPHPVPECECEIDGCHEHATCGAHTADGYKWMCSKHCRERRSDG